MEAISQLRFPLPWCVTVTTDANLTATLYFPVLRRHGQVHIQEGAIGVSTVFITVILSDPVEEAETVEERLSVQHRKAEFLTPTTQNT